MSTFDPDEFEFFGSRDYTHITKPWDTPKEEKRDLEKEIDTLKQEVSQLKGALRSIMDAIGSRSNHPLY
jgi:cell division septum initiation protein DivIVA